MIKPAWTTIHENEIWDGSVMIKYLSRMDEKSKVDCIDQIRGYDRVKDELRNQLNYITRRIKTDSIIPGVVLVGEKHHGRHFMMDVFIEATQKKAFIVNGEISPTEMDDLRAFMDQAARDEIHILVLDSIDRMKDEQIEDISDIVYGSDKSFYIFGITEEDEEQVRLCRTCGLIEYSVPVTDPFMKDTVQILQYLLYDKYREIRFDMDIEDLASVTYGLSFSEIEHILRASIREARSGNMRLVSEKLIMDAVMRRYFTPNNTAEYLTEKKIRETCIHEAGHAVMAELLKPRSVGYISVWLKGSGTPLGYTTVIREDIEYKGSIDEAKVLLAGLAAEEICNGYISPGCGGDIKKGVDIITNLIESEGCYGLEFYSRFSALLNDSEKANCETMHEVVYGIHIEVKDWLLPYKGDIRKIAGELSQSGYLYGKNIRKTIGSSL